MTPSFLWDSGALKFSARFKGLPRRMPFNKSLDHKPVFNGRRET
jgi:hypothetical protein